ncbi:hypothetical protein [Skermania piniformis]|uniref:PE domain-containing protein n=1 Tax=Skermania pinensis TaxID=39122 RepID=A0ABX8SFA3_9ACTN|nr:hypothetical protein [Skermania piniformis]QXQ14356.1 hypothetical protein KV203_02730 [Skermania piniformis]
MSMTVDPAELHALADRLVGQAERIDALDPLPPDLSAAVELSGSASAAATGQAAAVAAAVYRESADRYRALADTARRNAVGYVGTDDVFAAALRRVGAGRP